MRAYEYLYRLKDLDKEIKRSLEKEAELWAAATSATQALNGMPHAPGVCDKIGKAIARISEQKERTNALTDRYTEAKRDILAHLERLSPKQSAVLRWMFVEKRKDGLYYTWAEIAAILECSEQNIDKTRKRAIKSLQKLLDAENRA